MNVAFCGTHEISKKEKISHFGGGVGMGFIVRLGDHTNFQNPYGPEEFLLEILEDQEQIFYFSF